MGEGALRKSRIGHENDWALANEQLGSSFERSLARGIQASSFVLKPINRESLPSYDTIGPEWFTSDPVQLPVAHKKIADDILDGDLF